ncbi:MAG: Na(+)/H(+) antiporter subunit D [Betaproteobacteria bacterium RIFCSPLOWO2_02_FULL_65_24]|nr:MAG: Na(+)/H(+) antiporter subunit D [Betaproteobacteria bacterium RIFCSPLOWO2_02_FULL_65_24]OGA95300.1 MAG: Na(+)/H(+) antiporter subunit D [Betaproteobacteria bacterium RIFCSPLOWO2_12_FULL_66_14]
MSVEFSPGLTLIFGSLLVPVLRGRMRSAWVLILPVLGLAHLSLLTPGEFGIVSFLGHELVQLRVDRWSMVFGWIFMIAALLAAVYALHVRGALQLTAGFAYAGSATGALFAGDLITLFIYWELTAVTSLLLVWAGGTRAAYRAGMRYVIIQIASGMLLFFGALAQYNATGSLRFEHIGLDGPGGWLLFGAFGIKCAFPFLHNWLQDAYPESTEAGTVFLSAFTTKLAVYALARGFAGTEILVPIGAAMTAFPIFYAVIENDLRRVLAYSLNNQLGFMVVGIGLGTELSLNGTASHAFAHILYKALLFMSMGAVLFRVGTIKGSELGGLYKSMPYTTVFCIIGAASISGFPLFSGFVTKSMILSAAGEGGYLLAWGVLLFASAGVFHHSGIKIPYFAFFAHDSGKRCAEAPPNMLVAMAATAFLCVAIGVYPAPLYALLPYPVDYTPYTASHVLAQLQLLLFSALAFSVLMRYGIYPPELRSTNLDFDWIYRAPLVRLVRWTTRGIRNARGALNGVVQTGAMRIGHFILHESAEGRRLSGRWPTGSMALWMMVLLLAYLILYYA